MTSAMSDDEILAHLAAVLAEDRPPGDAMEAAYAAFGWRTLDADLARLVEDTQLEVVLFRQGSPSRRLSYESDHGTIALDVDDHSFELTVSPVARAVVVHRPWGSTELAVDAGGRATATGEPGPLRLGVVWDAGSAITPWTTL